MSDTVGGPTLHTIRGPATNVVPPPRLRCSAADRTCRWRPKNTSQRIIPPRSYFEAGRVLFQSSKKPARCPEGLKHKLPSAFSAILLFVGSIGWCWLVFNDLRSPVLVPPAEASIHPYIPRCQRLNRCRGKADSEVGKPDPFRSSTYAPSATSSLLFSVPRRDCAGETRSGRSGGFDALIGVVYSYQDVLDWIVSPCMGHEITMRNISGRQERHHPLQVAVPQF